MSIRSSRRPEPRRRFLRPGRRAKPGILVSPPIMRRPLSVSWTRSNWTAFCSRSMSTLGSRADHHASQPAADLRAEREEDELPEQAGLIGGAFPRLGHHAVAVLDAA